MRAVSGPTASTRRAFANAAGLLLVYPAKSKNAKAAKTAKKIDSLRALRSTSDTAHISATVRADTLGRHRGQVPLPGGVIDPGETFEQLRCGGA